MINVCPFSLLLKSICCNFTPVNYYLLNGFKMRLKLIAILLLTNTVILFSQAQSMIKDGAPNVYLDCRCDRSYIKEQIPVVNYVGDRQDADVHILFTDQRTGSGGREYSILFLGLNEFEGLDDTVKYIANQTETENLIRVKMADALKTGLVRYIYRSKIADQMKIIYSSSSSLKIDNTNDKTDGWDFWVFRTSLRTSFSGQQTSNSNNFEGSFSANRVTPENKINFWLNNSYNESNYDYEDYQIKSISRNQNISTSFIFSLDNHWSWGIWGSANKSTYGNIKLGLSASPGVEYNFFTYAEANQRQLRIEYRINSRINQYDQETIFFKTRENLFSQSMNISLELIEQWGNIGAGLRGSNYLHDLNLYSLGADGFVSLKLIKGLALDMRGNYSKINNQIALPKGDASLEEVLLHRKEIKTQYSYNFSVGISFTFGSIYNNAINPRFDG